MKGAKVGGMWKAMTVGSKRVGGLDPDFWGKDLIHKAVGIVGEPFDPGNVIMRFVYS